MTDAQSWPLDIPSIPELSSEGAYMKGLSYSPAEFKHIQVRRLPLVVLGGLSELDTASGLQEIIL